MSRADIEAGLGWIHLDALGGSPASGMLELSRGATVRAAPPDTQGRLAPVRATLKSNARVEVMERSRREGSDLVWARIRLPEAPSAPSQRPAGQ